MSVTASLADELQQRQCSRTAAGLTSVRSVHRHIMYKNGELKLFGFYIKYISSSLWIGVEQVFIVLSCFQCPVFQSVLHVFHYETSLTL